MSNIIVEIKQRKGKRKKLFKHNVNEKQIKEEKKEEESKKEIEGEKFTHYKEKIRNLIALDKKTTKKDFTKIIISKPMSTEELSKKIQVSEKEITKNFQIGEKEKINPLKAKEISKHFGLNVKLHLDKKTRIETGIKTRPPIVSVMGHVDHGKTSLIDQIRKTNVAKREKGGITQKLSAYSVEFKDKTITFVDSPGHSVFDDMRLSTLSASDIVVLIVACDSGIQQQTIECIQKAQEIDVTIVVAFNKVDKVSKKEIDNCRYQLLEKNVVVESLGGDVLETEISAKTGQNIQNLLENIILQGEILGLTADHSKNFEGVAIESYFVKGIGPVAMVILQNGKLELGDEFFIGEIKGKVKLILVENKRIKTLLPGMPAEIVGLDQICHSGEKITSEKRDIEYKKEKKEIQSIFDKTEVVDVVIKSSSQGYLKALKNAIKNCRFKERVKIAHDAIGEVLDGDVLMCRKTGAILLAFHSKLKLKKEKLDITYIENDIIYKLIEELEEILKDKNTLLGQAKIKKVFNLKVGNIAGCYVMEGQMIRGNKGIILRKNQKIHEFQLQSMKTEQSEIEKAKEGEECGILIKDFSDLKVGDIVQCLE